ncbi:MAG: hypothetical protein ABI599_09170 [Flavobacteriales bacterium]
MKDEWTIYHELLEEVYSDDELISELDDPFAGQIEINADHRFLDVGCGQSPLVLKFVRQGIAVTAMDENRVVIAALDRRLRKYGEVARSLATLVNGRYPAHPPPNPPFTMVAIRDVLHFHDRAEQKYMVQLLSARIHRGALVTVKGHSQEHIVASNPTMDSRYKWFFSDENLRSLFDARQYECLWTKTYEAKPTSLYVSFITKWVTRVGQQHGVPPSQIAQHVSEYLAHGPEITIEGLFRKL